MQYIFNTFSENHIKALKFQTKARPDGPDLQSQLLGRQRQEDDRLNSCLDF